MKFAIGTKVVISGTEAEFNRIYLGDIARTHYLNSLGVIEGFDETAVSGLAPYRVNFERNGIKDIAWFPEGMLTKVDSKELAEFKGNVRKTAISYAASNDLCNVVNDFLADLGLEPVRKISVNVDELTDSTRRYLFEYLKENDIPFEVKND